MGSQKIEIEGRNGEPNGVNREKLGNGRVEVRFADLERDCGRVAELFNQPSAIGHLSGVAPEETPPGIDAIRYGEKFPQYNVLVATKSKIKEYYRKRPNLILLVAEDKEKGIVGTVTVEGPGGLGITWAGVSRLVVDENERRKGIAKNLLRSAHAVIFTDRGSEGLGCLGSQAGIIRGVEGDDAAEKLFEGEGYRPRHIAKGNCVSWDNRLGRFVQRDTINVGAVVRDITRGWSRYFPQPKSS